MPPYPVFICFYFINLISLQISGVHTLFNPNNQPFDYVFVNVISLQIVKSTCLHAPPLSPHNHSMTFSSYSSTKKS